MSLTQTQIIREYEKEIGANRGDIADNALNLADFVAEENVAFDDYLTMAFQASGKWKFDDSNHIKLPEITTNLVANQRSYIFGGDEQGNLILDVYRVYALGDNGYYLLNPIDPDFDTVSPSIYDGNALTGNPYQYDKVGNAVLLDPVPVANVTNGLKVSINREASYFTTADTSKKPGVPGLHHQWFYLKPALSYARRNSLSSYLRLEAEVMNLEARIKKDFSRRAKDEQTILTAEYIDSK